MVFGWLAALGVLLCGTGESAPPDPQGIVGGAAVSTCGWPTTVYTGGCTATLVHPKAISTAQHCGMPSAIEFGESGGGGGPTVGVVGCVGDGSQDAMLCELAEEVTEVPVTPVLFGCEADTYLQPGQPVVMVGFGSPSFGAPGGTKLWADQTIASVEAGRVIVGEAGDGTSPCPGDSGGPVFVQVGDGSWRVFGTVLGGTTGTPCNSAADFQRIDTVVANFESQRGLDITPCFDAQSGAWEPGPDCGGFYAGDQTGSGTWPDWCEGTPAGGYSDECGTAYDDGGADESSGGGDAGESDDGGGTTSGGGEGEAGDGDADDDDAPTDDDDDDDHDHGDTDTDGPVPGAGGSDSGGCSVGARRSAGALMWLLPLLWWRRRS